MKKIIYFKIAAFLICAAFAAIAGCKKTPKFDSPEISLKLNRTVMSLVVGTTDTLIASVIGENNGVTLTWSSSNTDIASVSADGIVTAIAAGTANISVSAENSDNTATCALTVTTEPISVESVSLNKTTIPKLVCGDRDTLYATISPAIATNQKIGWYSSDTYVATVVAGIVKAGSNPGRVTVVAKTADKEKTDACNINVIAVSVSLNKDTLQLAVGAVDTLRATVNSRNKKVKYTSSNASVATVDSATGAVTAGAEGTANITATTDNGGKTATCYVSVRTAVTTIPVTGVTLNKTMLQCMPANTTDTLKATVLPANATNKAVTYFSPYTTVAEVNTNGVVTAKGAGMTTIDVSTDDGGYSATCTVTVCGSAAPNDSTTIIYTPYGTDTIKMVCLDSGSFMMGCEYISAREYYYCGCANLSHTVKLTTAFQIGMFEVTQKLWRVVMGSMPSNFETEFGWGDNHPMRFITFTMIDTFLTKLNELTGLSGLSEEYRFRLPTEAEWEYAARGNESYLYSGSNTIGDVAWYGGNSGNTTHPVGQKPPNGFGIYDMSGNVAEFCRDIWGTGDYSCPDGAPYITEREDPRGLTTGDLRIIRGGAYKTVRSSGTTSENECRVVCRMGLDKDDYVPLQGQYLWNKHVAVGFRLVRRVPSQP